MESKIGRNEPCPCNSGRKYKKCCGSPSASLEANEDVAVPDGTVAAFVDKKNERVVFLKDTMVVNQLRREGPKIAASFDNTFDEDIRQISEQFALSFGMLWCQFQHANKNEVRDACIQLLANASQTSVAALELVRHGFRLQPGILIRNAIETICVALSLFAEPSLFEAYEKGKLQSSKMVSRAKEIVPGLGWAYGFFSKEFAHIGQLHQQMTEWDVFEKSDQAADMNLRFIKFAVNLLTISGELICYDSVDSHRYWKRSSPGRYAYDPSKEEREWQECFLG
jgi:hypothetical protein